MEVLIEIVKAYGIYAGVAIYLIYSTRKDYTGLCKRHNALEDFIRDNLMQAHEAQTKASERSTTAIENNTKTLTEHQSIMQKCSWLKTE